MRRFFTILPLLLMATPPAQAQGILRRIFGGGGRQQVQHCQPVYYQQQYYQTQYYPTYQAVAAVPLATIPVAVDLQAYQYSVNATAFQSFRDYQSQKVAQVEATPGSGAVAQQPVPANVGSLADRELAGPAVLKQRCATCHTSGKIPRFFDAGGNLLSGAPLSEMLERITTDDPAARMPPKGQLPSREVMAVFNYAASGIVPSGERVAAVEPVRPVNPFE